MIRLHLGGGIAFRGQRGCRRRFDLPCWAESRTFGFHSMWAISRDVLKMVKALPDPDAAPHTDVVIYDGECNFCKAQVGRLRTLDLFGDRLTYLSLHDPRVSQRYPNLTHDQLMEQMYVIDQQGRQFGGSDAVRALSRRLPLLWPAMPIFAPSRYGWAVAMGIPSDRKASL